ncbi:halocyanin domain-containing protein [Halogeometricum sp. S1BR25-6]|uniref:Halocyanin domain-containing protein n=1 Tax=Halogeometricum salsisoli TaxID=2950536 RepID=A0ABU2GK76_9EURY|nr:halocyanin domain-containing protein [Halogeometricum sp. S1BR25-6]MDS0300816.1 halocyanin domain-containing protein [Halogeometricum sp. S1BR25-6]
MNDERTSRRHLLRAVAAMLAAGPSLAGCVGGETGAEQAETTARGDTEPNDRTFDGWLEGVANADTLVDRTDASDVRVHVGTEGDGGYFAFAPVVVRVSPGTTVTWEWTGAGGAHNVVAEDGSFRSELTGGEGTTFSHAFDAPGVAKYACLPHQSMGMKGVVVVE